MITWIYNKDMLTYGYIFAISRLSSSAIEFLYNKRLEHAYIFEKSTQIDKRWLNCEFFTPT